MRVPIEGAAGVGYVMRPGFDLPPMNFDVEEAEAITFGLNMIAHAGDTSLQKAAQRAARKIADATPLSQSLFTSTWGPDAPAGVDLASLREAIRQERKICITYLDTENATTTRVLKPLAVVYYAETIVLAASCELRQDFRHFRVDRIAQLELLQERFSGVGGRYWKNGFYCMGKPLKAVVSACNRGETALKASFHRASGRRAAESRLFDL